MSLVKPKLAILGESMSLRYAMLQGAMTEALGAYAEAVRSVLDALLDPPSES